MKEVVETWENIKFSVQPYYKGTQERGSVLGAVDEILLNVDNDAMNLQSMAGSRFVGPFLATIQQWEKDLSLISETIEVSESKPNRPSCLSQSIKSLLKDSISCIGLVAGATKMDVPGEHLHWWRYSIAVT